MYVSAFAPVAMRAQTDLMFVLLEDLLFSLFEEYISSPFNEQKKNKYFLFQKFD